MSKEKQEPYDPKRLGVHLDRDQSGRVDDEDKAREMAKVENRKRDLETKYRDYLAQDEETFLQKHPDFSDFTLYDFRVMKKAGVPPEYVRRYGDLFSSMGHPRVNRV